jgi:hypothetical protein
MGGSAATDAFGQYLRDVGRPQGLRRGRRCGPVTAARRAQTRVRVLAIQGVSWVPARIRGIGLIDGAEGGHEGCTRANPLRIRDLRDCGAEPPGFGAGSWLSDKDTYHVCEAISERLNSPLPYPGSSSVQSSVTRPGSGPKARRSSPARCRRSSCARPIDRSIGASARGGASVLALPGCAPRCRSSSMKSRRICNASCEVFHLPFPACRARVA